jgi:hypothetical protein
LLPLGIPLGLLAVRLLGQAAQIMLPGSSRAEKILRRTEDFFTSRRR